MKELPKEIYMFTDGASRGNPGKGGYGAVLLFGTYKKEKQEGFRMTTNNRMELKAIVEGLKMMRKTDLPIKVYSDSKYVVDAIEKGWVWGWEKKGFAKKANEDLWKEFLKQYRRFKIPPKFHWVKGHAGHAMNERCDQLATAAADQGPWLEDVGYNQGE